MKKYTPGRWELRGPRIVTDSNGVLIAKNISANYPDTPESNARLIAAAPELLEALEYAVNWAEGYADANGDTPAFLSDARAAIARATGEV